MRNLGLIISFWLTAIGLPSQVLALGLGEIEVNSFLNQPLKAEIEIISARPGEIDDLLVGLASRDAFSRAGLTRPNNLSHLRFAVKKSEAGDSAAILVTTKAAVKEPFLNFLVEADWSKGRLLREFTILLDPPFYADNSAPAPQPEPVAEAETIAGSELAPEVPKPVVESPDTTRSSNDQPELTESITFNEAETEVNDRTGTASSDASGVAEVLTMVESSDAQGDVTIAKGDTLWSIAKGLRGSGHSMSQIMLAIQRANPEAFGDDNINNLKVGVVLRLPEVSEFGKIDEQQAYAEVLEQNGLWDDYVARVTGVAAVTTEEVEVETKSTTGSQAQSSKTSGELSLLTPGDGESDAAGLQSEGEDANELSVKLALAEEELDAARVENRDLESRIAELEARLSKFEALQKMVEIEDDSLARLQAELAQEEDTTAEEQTTTTPPVPVIVTEAESASILDSILPADILDVLPSMDSFTLDPVLLGGLGGIILLLIGLIVYRRMKRDDTDDGEVLVNDSIFVADEDDENLTPVHLGKSAIESFEDDSDINLPDEAGTPESIMDGGEEQEEDDEFARTAIVSRDDLPEPEAPEPAVEEQDDILNEADVYLAYNLYDNAEELLTQNLESNPERADYRSKLLDTHYATRNVDAFIREAKTLKSMGSPANRYWDRVQVMGYELAPDNELFADAKDSGIRAADLEISKPAAADFDLGASQDDTDFSTTVYDLGNEDTITFETTDYSAVELGIDEETPVLEENDFTNINAETEAESIPEESADAVEDVQEDALDFELPEDLDLAADDDDDSSEGASIGVDKNLSEGDIFGMEDTATLQPVTEDVEGVELDSGDFDDKDSLAMEIDMGGDSIPKTGTFVPGDFEDSEDDDSTRFEDIVDLMLPDDVDEVSTKLDLARAFIDMGDSGGARSSLDEVMSEGNDEQKAEAQALLDQL